MRILLLGSTGQLGWELQRTLATLGDVKALDYPQVDFTRPETLAEAVKEYRAQVVVNSAAYTDVDKAERETEIALMVNAEAPGALAETCRKNGAAFVHYSTDYVFDGRKGTAYVEEDTTAPLNAYGRSKLEGEQAVQAAGGSYLILRTSWVYSLRRPSFVTKVLQWSRERETLRVVDDQIGSPTWARALAEASAQVLAMGGAGTFGWLSARRGVYHLAGDGAASRLEWARAILKYDPDPAKSMVREVVAAASDEFATPALRPLVTPLDCGRFYEAFGLRLPPWEHALALAMEDFSSGNKQAIA
jgi:dTDP-4-dehydrorhamnose reductase